MVTSSYAEHGANSVPSLQVVHPAIGVTIRWKKGEDRAEVPVWSLRLRDMWECTIGSTDTLSPCVVCGTEDDTCETCRLCLRSWHEGCCEALVSSEVFQAELDRLLPPSGPLPVTFSADGDICRTCFRWSQHFRHDVDDIPAS